MTFNIFGCHKLYTPDIARQVDACWFSHGTLDLDSGFFFLSYAAILQQLQHHLEHCGFWPALTQEKISIGLSLLPFALNPECDSRWRYWPARGKPAGVIPTGHDIAIAPPNSDFAHLDPSELIEVGPTPYIEKLLAYLETHNLDDLGMQNYRGLSTCVHCGVPYKPHTMVCSKCKTDFWKYALHDLDQILLHLRSTTPVTLSAGPQSASSDGGPRSIPSQQPQLPEEEVSFEQLWSDPQVQQMLSNAPSTPDTPASQPVSSKSSATDFPQKIGQQAPPSDLEQHRHSLQELAKSRSASFPERPSSGERLQFHEKIWSLISKKYRERRAIESAFSPAQPPKTSTSETPASTSTTASSPAEPQSLPSAFQQLRQADARASETRRSQQASPEEHASAPELAPENAALLNAIKSLKPRQKSELSKRGVVRVVYIATMDKDVCPLCAYLDGMVMDPDDPATDIFSPPLYPGCTCRREYVLKTEKPQNWPRVTFKFPPKELLVYLDKGQS